MKETGLHHWYNLNTGATNRSGFSGLPGVRRAANGLFSNTIGNTGLWWSSTEGSQHAAFMRSLSSGDGNVKRYSYSKGLGLSVRCLRD